MNYLPLIVISGPSGRGKTEVSRRISTMFGYKTINVGNVLHQRLMQIGVCVGERKYIGVEFFKYFNDLDYERTLVEIAGDGIILDGVRLFSGVVELRKKHANLIHIHLAVSLDQSANFEHKDFFFQENHFLDDIADLKIDWFEQVQDINTELENKLIPLLRRRKREYSRQCRIQRSRSRNSSRPSVSLFRLRFKAGLKAEGGHLFKVQAKAHQDSRKQK